MPDEDVLGDYTFFEFADQSGCWRRPVYRRGAGPAVIVIHEMPGLHPLVRRFADRIAAAGMTVFCPSLFGSPGQPVSPGYVMGTMLTTLRVRREFNVWAPGRYWRTDQKGRGARHRVPAGGHAGVSIVVRCPPRQAPGRASPGSLGPMTGWRGVLAILACAVLVSGCASVGRISAAQDVHALLISVRDDDRAAFDAHVDRPAIEARLQARIMERTRRANGSELLEGFAAVASGPLSRAAVGALVRPDVLRAVAEYYGYTPRTPIPSVLALAAALKALPDDQVCATLRESPKCLLTFADEGGVWRLVDFDAFALLGHRGA